MQAPPALPSEIFYSFCTDIGEGSFGKGSPWRCGVHLCLSGVLE